MKVDADVLLPFTSFCSEGIITREVKEDRSFDTEILIIYLGTIRATVMSHQIYQLPSVVEMIVVL